MAAIRVPDTTNFNLLNVYDAVNDHANPSGDLRDCFAKSVPECFHPDYDNAVYAPANSLKRFRGYGPPYQLVSFNSASHLSGSLDPQPHGVFATDTGLILLIMYSGGVLKKYSMPTAFAVNSLNYQTSKTIGTGSFGGIHLDPNYGRYYIANTGSYVIEQWGSGFPTDIANMTYVRSFSNFPSGFIPVDVTFNSSGTVMMVAGVIVSGSETWVLQYDLTTAWDISTASLDYSLLLDMAAFPFVGIHAIADGKIIMIQGQNPNYTHQLYLSTGWDLRTLWWWCNGGLNSLIDEFANGIWAIPTSADNEFHNITGIHCLIAGSENDKVYYDNIDRVNNTGTFV